MKKFILFILILFLSCSQFIKAADCPDLIITSIKITSIVNTATYRTINYSFTLQNIGTSTVTFREIIMQNYTSTDSSISKLSAIGGAYMYAYNTSIDILPGASYTGTYYAADTKFYTYLIDQVSIATAECNTANNYYIRTIKVDNTTGIKTLNQPEIIWDSYSNILKIAGNSTKSSYKVFDMNGRIRLSGIAMNNENIPVLLRPGIYFIDVYDNRKKVSKKIVVE